MARTLTIVTMITTESAARSRKDPTSRAGRLRRRKPGIRNARLGTSAGSASGCRSLIGRRARGGAERHRQRRRRRLRSTFAAPCSSASARSAVPSTSTLPDIGSESPSDVTRCAQTRRSSAPGDATVNVARPQPGDPERAAGRRGLAVPAGALEPHVREARPAGHDHAVCRLDRSRRARRRGSRSRSRGGRPVRAGSRPSAPPSAAPRRPPAPGGSGRSR